MADVTFSFLALNNQGAERRAGTATKRGVVRLLLAMLLCLSGSGRGQTPAPAKTADRIVNDDVTMSGV